MGSPITRRRRSALYLPASNHRAIEKARSLDCDVIILDLEDAVAPNMKIKARDLAVAAIREGGFGTRELVVRVNGIDTDWGAEDISALTVAMPDGILVPKIGEAAALSQYVEALGGQHAPIWAMIETTLSVFRLEEIAATSRSGPLTTFVMGTNDLAKEMGAQPDIARTPFIGIFGLAVAAARAYGLTILDGVFNNIDDAAGLEEQLQQAVTFGFDGKTLIHPGQIAACNKVFTPNDGDLAWAKRIVAAFDSPDYAGKGAIRLEGRMVERLHLHQALRTIAAAGV